jgi:hypothetical protein
VPHLVWTAQVTETFVNASEWPVQFPAECAFALAATSRDLLKQDECHSERTLRAICLKDSTYSFTVTLYQSYLSLFVELKITSLRSPKLTPFGRS